MTAITAEALQRLQSRPESIRNFCLLAHVDHGKTTLADLLIATNGIISSKIAGTVRYLDTREDEIDRGITMKSSAISLHFEIIERNRDSDEQETCRHFLLNLIDSPGHVDFTSEVFCASRLVDGAFVLVDAVEGVCSQTVMVLRQAWSERLKPVLIINKVDRLAVELRLSPIEAYYHLRRLLEQVNAVQATLFTGELTGDDESSHPKDDSQIYFSPEKGTVIFASAIDGWAFRLSDFAAIFAQRVAVSFKDLQDHLWDEYDLKKNGTFVRIKRSASATTTPLFVRLCLENIWAIYGSTVIERNTQTVEKIIDRLNLKILPRDVRSKDAKKLASVMLSKWLPLARTILLSAVFALPDPVSAQKLKMSPILQESKAITCSESMKRALLNCDMDSKNAVAFVSKMVAVPMTDLPRVLNQSIASHNQLSRAPSADYISSQFADGAQDAVGVQPIVRPGESAEQENEDYIVKKKSDCPQAVIGFARVLCGKIHRGQKIWAYGLKYDASKSEVEHRSECMIQRLFMMMGKDLVELEEVSAGNVCGIYGLEGHVQRTGTLCTEASGLNLMPRTIIERASLVRVAVEPEHPSELAQLEHGMHLLNMSDPSVEYIKGDMGENLLVAAGELHLERCIRDLTEQFANIQVQVSPPIVPFRETIVNRVTNTAESRDSGNQNLPLHQKGVVEVLTSNGIRLQLRVFPLSSELRAFLHENIGQLGRLGARRFGVKAPDELDESALAWTKSHLSLTEVRRQLDEQLRKEPFAGKDVRISANQIVSFGPKRLGVNILFDTTGNSRMLLADEQRDEHSASAKMRIADGVGSAFQLFLGQGPLCAEPVEGVGVTILKMEIDQDEGKPQDDKLGTESCSDNESRRESNNADGPQGGNDESDDSLNNGSDPTRFGSSATVSSGQMITHTRDALVRGFMMWSPRLMLAMYTCDIQTSTDVLGRVYAVVSRRKGRVIDEEMREGTSIFSVHCLLPVSESFGFADELRKRTSGAATAQLLFYGFEELPIDPFWVPASEEELEDLGETADRENFARVYMDAIRSRKGLFVEKKIIEHAEKQRNIKKR